MPSAGWIAAIVVLSVVMATLVALLVLWGVGVLWTHGHEHHHHDDALTCDAFAPFTRAAAITPNTAQSGTNVACTPDAMTVVEQNNDTGAVTVYREQGGKYVVVQAGTLECAGPIVVRDDGLSVASFTADQQVRMSSGTHTRPLSTPRTLSARSRHLQFHGQDLYVSTVDALGRGTIDVYSATATLERFIVPPARANNDAFAVHFAVSGNWLIAASPLARVAEVFRRADANASFRHNATIRPAGVTDSVFPHRVAIASDGSWAALSNPTHASDGISESGSVLVFRRDGQAYVAAAGSPLEAPTPDERGNFGFGLATLSATFLQVSEGFGVAANPGNIWVYKWDGRAMVLHSVLTGDVVGTGTEAPFGLTVAMGRVSDQRVRMFAGQPSKTSTTGHLWYWDSVCQSE